MKTFFAFALLLALPGVTFASAKSFNPKRDVAAVATCDLVYDRLERASARLPVRELRTSGVVTAYRGDRRLAPLIEAVTTAGEKSDFAASRSMTSTLLVGALQVEEAQHEKENPGEVEARFFAKAAAACDRTLSSWGVPADEALPPDVVQYGFAEFRLALTPVAAVFTDARDVAVARAACDGDAGAVARALSAGGRVNASGLQGITPLAWSTACWNRDGMEALLAAGADPNQVLGKNGTVVLTAAGVADPRLLAILLAHGGDPNANDGDETALSRAFWVAHVTGDWTNWTALVAAGADLTTEVIGFDAMNQLVISGYDERAYHLLESGYRGDLVALGRTVTVELEEPGSKRRVWLHKLQDALAAKGVRFPVGALGDLKQGPDGRYIQE